MKNRLLIRVTAVLLFFCLGLSLSAASVTEVTIGGSTSEDIDNKWGLALSTEFWNEINYLFAWGLNTQMIWYQWDRYVLDENGERVTETVNISGVDQTQNVVETANAFLFPVFLEAKLQYPVSKHVYPYIAGGMGYTVMPLISDDEGSKLYGGFSWQVHGGVALEFPDVEDFRIIGDIKYRNARIRNQDNVELDMSGWQFSAGVQFGHMMSKGNQSSGIMW